MINTSPGNIQRGVLALRSTCVALALFSGPLENNLFSALWGARHNGTLAAYERTRYQAVQAEVEEGNVNIYGNGVFYYTLPDRYGARGLFHLVKSLQPRPGARILILGGGIAGLAAAVIGFEEISDAGLTRLNKRSSLAVNIAAMGIANGVGAAVAALRALARRSKAMVAARSTVVE